MVPRASRSVTEMITSISCSTDRVASGRSCRFGSATSSCCTRWIRINRHPYASPSPGRITQFHVPGGPGIRVDSHVYANYFVPPNYDSLIGKVIAWADTREQAIAKMRIALSEMIVEGIETNLPLHQELMLDSAFLRGGTSIHYLEEKLSKQTRPD